MARKNKKKNINGFIFPTPFAGVVGLISTLALAYVWLGCRCESLGREIKALERNRSVLVERYRKEECGWSRMKSPPNIEKALAQHNILMSWPRRDQVVRLYLYDPHTLRDASMKMVDNVLTYTKVERFVMND